MSGWVDEWMSGWVDEWMGFGTSVQPSGGWVGWVGEVAIAHQAHRVVIEGGGVGVEEVGGSLGQTIRSNG